MHGENMLYLIQLLCVLLTPAAAALGKTSKDFVPLLVDLPGWECEETEAFEMAMGDVTGISVSRCKEKGGEYIEADTYATLPSDNERLQTAAENTLTLIKARNQ